MKRTDLCFFGKITSFFMHFSNAELFLKTRTYSPYFYMGFPIIRLKLLWFSFLNISIVNCCISMLMMLMGCGMEPPVLMNK
jgi:hypothetical protein